MAYSNEEIRSTILEIISGKERGSFIPNQYLNLQSNLAEVFGRRNPSSVIFSSGKFSLNKDDRERFLEVFWDLFRQNIITLGSDDSNPNFPNFHVSSFGKKILDQETPYFFHNVSSYESVIRENIPDIDETTLIYLKEAMQAFQIGCLLSSSVMLGVAIEFSFEQLLETINSNVKYTEKFKNAVNERTILRKLTKFQNIIHELSKELPPEIKEDFDTNLSGIISIIRNFRNESGHPSGKIISREQCFVLLHLFIPCCKKIYQTREFFLKNQ